MTTYRDPSFQDRMTSAAKAKQKALEQLRSRPPVDPQVLAERRAASLKRDTKKAERIAARNAAKQEAADTAAAEASNRAAAPPPPTEAERKAERDARYAARKNRK